MHGKIFYCSICKNCLYLLGLLLFGGFAQGNAYALDIRIDLSERNGAPGGSWNSISLANANSTTSNLIDYDTGTPTSISLTGNGWEGEWDGLSPAEDWLAGDTNDRLYISESGTTKIGQFVFANLSDSDRYQVEFYTEGDITIVETRVNGNLASRNAKEATRSPSIDLANWDQTFDGNINDWLIWDDVAPVGGVITFTTQRTGGGPYINANNLRLLLLTPPVVPVVPVAASVDNGWLVVFMLGLFSLFGIALPSTASTKYE